MKIRNKKIRKCIKACHDVLMCCGEKLSKMYDEDECGVESQSYEMPHSVETYEEVETIGTSHVEFNENIEKQNIGKIQIVNEDDNVSGTLNFVENLNFRKLIQETADLIARYDNLANQLVGDSKELLLDVSLKLIENLIRSGCTPIVDDRVYDMKRHRVFPYSIVNNGIPIKHIQRVGVEWNNEVFVLAIVEI